MKDKDLDRIKNLYIHKFKNIIMLIATSLYDYGYNLLSGSNLSGSDKDKKEILLKILHRMFNKEGLSYLLFDPESLKLFNLKLSSLTIIDIIFNGYDDNVDYIINVDYDIDADAKFILYEEDDIDDETFTSLLYLHTVTSEFISRHQEYFKEPIPHTNPKLYHPCDDLSPFDFTLMVNMVDIMDFVSYGLNMLHYYVSLDSQILDDNRLVMTKEQIMSIDIFLQDIARKISLFNLDYYKNNINLVYAVPFVNYNDIATDDYAKKSLIGKRKIKLNKNEYVLGEFGIDIVIPKLAILTYQNS